MNRFQSKATGTSSKASSRKMSEGLPPFAGGHFDGHLSEPKVTRTVAARIVGGQAQRFETTPANKE